MKEVLLKCCGDSGFAAGRKPGEPDCEAFLGAEKTSFGMGEGGMPCDVAERPRQVS